MTEGKTMGWSVTVEFASDRPAESDDVAVRVAERLERYGAVVTMMPTLDRIGITVSIDTEVSDLGALKAVDQALARARRAVRAEGLRAGWELVEVEMMTWAQQEHRLAEPLIPPLVGAREVAALLGVSRQRATQVAQRADFPRPVAQLAAGPVWLKSAVDRFVERWPRQPGRPWPRRTPVSGTS